MAYNVQFAFAAGEISPSLYGRADIAKFQTAAKLIENFTIRPQGGLQNRAGTEYIADAYYADKVSRLIPFSFNIEQTYSIEAGEYVMRFFANGGLVERSAQTVTAVTMANPAVITIAGHGLNPGDLVRLAGDVGDIAAGDYRVHTTPSADTLTLRVLSSNLTTVASGATTPTGGTLKWLGVATDYAEPDLFELKFTQSNDVMILTHPGYEPKELSRITVGGSVQFKIETPTYTLEDGLSFTSENNRPAAVTYHEQRLNFGGTNANPQTTFMSNVGEYDRWKPGVVLNTTYVLNGVTLANPIVIEVTNYATVFDEGQVIGFTSVGGTVELNDGRYVVGPQSGGSPDLFELHDEDNNPIDGTSGYTAFTAGGEVGAVVFNAQSDSDNIEYTIAANQVNVIRHLVSFDDLVILTSGAEWIASGGTAPISPTNVRVRRQSSYGVAHPTPIVTGSSLLYVQNGGTRVRDFAYEFESDSYVGNDLTILAYHLFDGDEIKDWAHATLPHSIIWCVMASGDVRAMTFIKEQNIWGWTRQTTSGLFEAVCAIRESSSEDAVYLIVKRTINGATKRFIERLHTRVDDEVADCFFVDCGLSYDGSPATTISGLDHLDGEEVVILADGNVIEGKTVSSGEVVLDNAASVVHVGLAYTCDVETLPIDQIGDNHVGASRKMVKRANVRVEKSRGLFVGPDAARLFEVKQRKDEDYGDPTELYTGIWSINIHNAWNDEGTVLFRQSYPLPLTINTLVLDFDVGR